MFRWMVISLVFLWSGIAMAELKTEEFSYSGGGVEMSGFIAWDDTSDKKRPGILVVHEWWGQNDYPRKRAKMLARLGYTALAIDMYGGRKTAAHPGDAGAFMTEVVQNMDQGRERFEAALSILKKHPTVDETKTGAIGYCFGGGVVLHMARVGSDLDVVASFHGSLQLASTEGVEEMTTRVVAYNGKADPFVTAEAIEGFVSEMESAGADYDLIQIPGAVHGFTNPAATSNGEKYGIPLKYNLLADEASWAHMQLELQAAFAD